METNKQRENSFERGCRINIWRQDPTVKTGVRTVFLPNDVFAGPSDSQIAIKGLPTSYPDENGDFLFPPPKQVIMKDLYNPPEITLEEQRFDAAHTYAVVKKVIIMYERALGKKIQWVWNLSSAESSPLEIYPHANKGKNAYYERDSRALRFEYFYRVGDYPLFTCRSLDIVSHEAGHAIIDSLKPLWNLTEPERGLSLEIAALQESLCDLTSIFLILSELDLVDYIVVETKADLKRKDNILAVWCEQLELIPGISGARSALNEIKLSEAGTHVHRISQVFTGAMYYTLAEVYTLSRNPSVTDDAETLYLVSKELFRIIIEAILNCPEKKATFFDLASELIRIAKKRISSEYAEIMKQNFIHREIITSDQKRNRKANLEHFISGIRGYCCRGWETHAIKE